MRLDSALPGEPAALTTRPRRQDGGNRTGFLADPVFDRSICERTLLAGPPTLQEIDGPLLFLATAASSYMTGQVLVIDGGWTAL
jgi:NAD(P)-dependent dehydrogenase (short-subunit alcohol dehydrogenase family)